MFESLWLNFLQHRGSFIIARMRDWHCLVTVHLYVHVCMTEDERGDHCLVPNCWSPIFVSVCVSARDTKWVCKWMRQRLIGKQTGRMTKTERGLYVTVSITTQSVTCYQSWFYCRFGTGSSQVSGYLRKVKGKYVTACLNQSLSRQILIINEHYQIFLWIFLLYL